MGADFPEKAAKTFKKSWDRGRCELNMENLFSKLASRESRRFMALPEHGCTLSPGQRMTAEMRSGQLVLTQGFSVLAVSASPPADIAQALSDGCGVAPAVVTQAYPLSGMIEVTLGHEN